MLVLIGKKIFSMYCMEKASSVQSVQRGDEFCRFGQSEKRVCSDISSLSINSESQLLYTILFLCNLLSNEHA